jgi:hypothetical protein
MALEFQVVKIVVPNIHAYVTRYILCKAGYLRTRYTITHTCLMSGVHITVNIMDIFTCKDGKQASHSTVSIIWKRNISSLKQGFDKN